MKVVAFNGSPRKEGNTAQLIAMVAEPLEKAGIEVETVSLCGRPLRGCQACYACAKKKDGRCAIEGDSVNDWIEAMFAADGIILASPTYVSSISAEMKALMDRACIVARVNGNPLRRKVGAALSPMRRAGAVSALDTMQHFFFVTEMVAVGSSYWNLAIGREKGEVQNDAEGMATMKALGENMAWLLTSLKS